MPRFESHFPLRTVIRKSRLPLAAALCISSIAIHVRAADDTPADRERRIAVQQAIARGAGYLRGKVNMEVAGHRALVALALYKAGMQTNTPELQGAIAEVLGKISNGEYQPKTHHLYEAGVDASLLADLGGEVEPGHQHPFGPQLLAIATYIQGKQLSNGGWDYPTGRDTQGDTSVVQYALLGLWAAERSGVRVPPLAWQNAIQWHISNQNSDGGFAYVPGTNQGFGQGNSVLNMTINAIGSTYIAIWHINAGELPDVTNPRIVRPEDPKAPDNSRFGVLEKVDLTKAGNEPGVAAPPRAKVPPGTEQLITRAYHWLETRFAAVNNDTGFRAYYYYSLERMGALTRVEVIGKDRWFAVCADVLIKQQASDGSWALSQQAQADTELDTAFAVLFLTRSTAKILHLVEPVDPIGSGLAKGHRGGLENLPNVGRDGTVQKSLGSLDELLKQLESPGDVSLQDVQEQLVEQVQITDRKTLIGQKDLLVRYARHPNAEVRRTALWALGRTDDFSLAKLLINAIDDPDLGVLIEARNALCWLARKPNGLGEAASPLENLPENATDDQKAAATATWHAELVRKWGTWYLQNRPYADRGDEFEAELLQKIAAAN